MSAGGLVGRSPELAVLDELVARTLAGMGAIVLLAGEPGIGKTRLALATTERATAAGARVVWGRCRESEGAPPLWPWTAVLRTIGIDPHRLEAPTDTTARFRQFEEIAAALGSTASGEPLLVVLDDVHRADELSLRLLAHLGDTAWPAPLGLLVTYRDHEVGALAATTVADLAHAPGARRCQLVGLDLGDIAALLDRATIDASTMSATELLGRTAGNPLFITELLACSRRADRPTACRPASVRSRWPASPCCRRRRGTRWSWRPCSAATSTTPCSPRRCTPALKTPSKRWMRRWPPASS
jgi:predicted ATPase